MSTNPPFATGLATEGAMPAPSQDLAVLKRGAKDYVDFFDATKDVFYAYLYHRTGSSALASTIFGELYVDTIARVTALWWFGSMNLRLLIDAAEKALKDRQLGAADLDTVYLPSLAWLSAEDRSSVGTLHDALWSLPNEQQRLLILSLLVGLSDERIATDLAMPLADVRSALASGMTLLLSRWQPSAGLADKLQSLVFAPALTAAADAALRFAIIEKYNALRFRRYQWVMLGGLFAVMSNVIVASVLAFVVITAPPSSLHGTRSQVASLDALLLKRQIAIDEAKGSVAASFREAQRITAYDVSRDFTALGLASALESLKAQQHQEAEVDRLIKIMQRAQTAMGPLMDQILVAWESVKGMVGLL